MLAACIAPLATAPLLAAGEGSGGKGDLAPAYVDGSFGFSVQYPAGATIEREKKFVSKADLEIVRFVQTQHVWSLVVRLTSTTQPLSADTIVQGITDNLRTTYPDLKVIRSTPVTIAARESVRFAAHLNADGKPWIRQQAVIPKEATEYYTLIFITPAEDEQVALPAFERICSSFEILRSRLKQEQIDAALSLGAEIKRRIASDNPRLAAAGAPRDNYLKIIQAGKEIGFVRIHQAAIKVGHRPGIGIRESGWLFQTEGEITTVQFQHDKFLADDLTFSKWDNLVRTMRPLPAGTATTGRTHQVDLAVERGLQERDKLLVDYTLVPGDPEMKGKVIEIEPSFAPPALLTLLPQFVDLDAAELYAFPAFDSNRHGLILRTFRVVGPGRANLDGQPVTTIRIEESEGLLTAVSETDVDRTGRILRLKAGPLEMLNTTQQYVERQYKTRVDEAEALFRKHPVPMPTPAAAPSDSGNPPSGEPARSP